MKAALISFGAGVAVGILYGVIRVKSPAPPLIALLGLLGIVLGEQFGGWILARRVTLVHLRSSASSGRPTTGSSSSAG